jgi:L-threonylcarbamoyladenylate synthase
MTVIYRGDDLRQVERVVSLLKAGQAVALPTETVYGLAALALDEKALSKIFKLKNRPTFDPLIVHVLGIEDVSFLKSPVSELEHKLVKKFWPGPLTLLFKKSAAVPSLCTAATEWVAFRSPAHAVFRDVLRRVKAPLAAPSANRFGRISTTSAEDVVKELGPFGLEAVLDGGRCEHGLESTVVKCDAEKGIEVIRLGAISVEALRAELGTSVPIFIRPSGSGANVEKLGHDAPGQLAAHYAPRSPLLFYDSLSKEEQLFLAKNPNNYAWLSINTPMSGIEKELYGLFSSRARTLTNNNSDVEAASQLFRVLRELDELLPKAIILGPGNVGDGGLWPAIFDRLRRASSAIALAK